MTVISFEAILFKSNFIKGKIYFNAYELNTAKKPRAPLQHMHHWE